MVDNIGKYNTEWTKEKYERFIKEGRGLGEGESYKPWLTIQDFPSMGRATRIMGWKTKRIHHFFSDLQLKYFYLLEWEESVVDIREHYPLLDFDEVIEDKMDLRLDKFIDRKTKVPYVLSTIFLITLCKPGNKVEFVARSIKIASDLQKKITIERLEAERRYWSAKGIDWGIVTNKDINTVMSKNVEWLHSTMNTESYNGIKEEQLDELAEGLLYRLKSSESVRKIIRKYEKDYCLDAGTGILLFKYLLLKRKIFINMNEPIKFNIPGQSLWLP